MLEFIPNNNFKIQAGDWNGYTLILPCVSVGNVPQLTVDLLVNERIQNSSKKVPERDLELVGSLWSESVYPFAGVDPYFMNGNNHATSIQVFASKSMKLVIIQQRSPVYKECRKDFYNDLCDWIGRHQFEAIVVLSSSFDHFLVPELHQYMKVPIKYLGYSLNDSLRDHIQKTKLIQPISPVDPETMIPKNDGRIYLPGSGSTRGYIKKFTKAFPKTPIVCLVLFCSEGENQQHARFFADTVAELINRDKTIFPVRKHAEDSTLIKYEWETPWSWRRMFGNEPPMSMF